MRALIRLKTLAFYFMVTLAMPWILNASESAGRDIREVLGVTHVSGKYRFTTNDFMKEGVDRIESLGTRVVKLWFALTPGALQKAYGWGTRWPEDIRSLADLAKTPQYRYAFSRPFKHYLLETFAPEVKWTTGFSAESARIESEQIYELTKYLLTEYRGSGKTFVLQNWEGDNAVSVKGKTVEEQNAAFQGFVDWMNCRQEAVSRARKEFGTNGVKVVAALEMNFVPSEKESFQVPLVVDRVVPQTRMDLYSISSWGTKLPGTEEGLYAKLDYIASKAPASAIYGRKNVMVGEFGGHERMFENPKNCYPELGGDTGKNQLAVVKKQLDAALRWGAPYIVFWEIYCNEWRNPADQAPAGVNAKAEQLNGHWLIRPDGSATPTWDYFKELLAK